MFEYVFTTFSCEELQKIRRLKRDIRLSYLCVHREYRIPDGDNIEKKTVTQTITNKIYICVQNT